MPALDNLGPDAEDGAGNDRGFDERDLGTLGHQTSHRLRGLEAVDVTELDVFELPGAVLGRKVTAELEVDLDPVHVDEFTCAACFLVHHRSQLAGEPPVCADCR